MSGPKDERTLALRQELGRVVQLAQSWMQLASATDLASPVALDQLSMQTAAVAQAMHIVTDRSGDLARELLDRADAVLRDEVSP